MPGLQHLLYPNGCDAAAAEKIVAASRLVSCHSFWRYHNLWLEKIAHRHRVPFWFVPHGGLDPYVFTTGTLSKRLFMRLGGERFLDAASGVICATRREYDKLRPLMPYTPHAVIPWPLADSDFRQPNEPERAALRQRLGVRDDQFLLLSLGRLHPMKRPLDIIRAVAESGRPDVHVAMAGNEDGVSRSDCLTAARQYGIEQRFHFLGPVFGEDKAQWLNAADTYISLSRRENFNFSCAEAMAAGLSVILSQGNDLASDLTNERCGWMLSEDDEAADAISAAATLDRLQRDAMGARAREWALRNLQFSDFSARVQQFSQRIVTNR